MLAEPKGAKETSSACHSLIASPVSCRLSRSVRNEIDFERIFTLRLGGMIAGNKSK
jgi:hypothetical protein